MIKNMAILYQKWRKSDESQKKIIGVWPEDNHEYEIEVPPQIRDEVIKLQNILVDIVNELVYLESRKNKIDKVINEIKYVFNRQYELRDEKS